MSKRSLYFVRVLSIFMSVMMASIGVTGPMIHAAAAVDKTITPNVHLNYNGVIGVENILKLPLQQVNGRFYISLIDADYFLSDIRFLLIDKNTLLIQTPDLQAVLKQNSTWITLNGTKVQRKGIALTRLNGSSYLSLGELAALLGEPITYDAKSRTITFNSQGRYLLSYPDDPTGVWIHATSGELYISKGAEKPALVATMEQLGNDHFFAFNEQISEDTLLITVSNNYESRIRNYWLLFYKGQLVLQTKADYSSGIVREGEMLLLPDGDQILWVRPDGTIEHSIDTVAAVGEQASVVYAAQDILLFRTIAKPTHVLYYRDDQSTVVLYKEIMPLWMQHKIEESWTQEGVDQSDLLEFSGRDGNMLTFSHRILFFPGFDGPYKEFRYELK